jgi:alpha-beta hydrolase superfamily lysophospholipase
MGEHAGRYAGLAEFFGRQGFATLAHDHHGHGKTTGKKGHVRHYDLFYDELDAMAQEAQRRFPNLPVLLWGHSLGGAIVLSYVIKRSPSAYRAVVATSSAIKLAFEPAKLLVAIGKLTRKIAPGFTQHNQLNPADLSHDPEVVKAYKEDPLVHAYVSSELGLSTLEIGEALYTYTGEFGLPLLLMHGTEDRITSYRGSEMFARQAKGNITYKPWEGLFHETHQEPQREEVLQFAKEWMEGVLG